MRRWLELLAFAFAALVTQLVWLDFAPILVEIEKRFSVDETTASALILPFPLLYVLLSLPAGRLIDRRGVRVVVGAGAVVTAIGACVRIDAGSFAALVVGQVIASIAQPFVVNGIAKLVAERFSDAESAAANGLGTVGMFLGMAAGLASTPPLVDAFDLRGAMIAHALVAVLAAIAWFVVVLDRSTRGAATTSAPSPWLALLKNKKLFVLNAASFAGLGYFNGLTTWLEQLLAPRGVDANTAGVVGGALIGGGIAGAVVVPLLADKLRRRKLPFIACVIVASTLNAVLAFTTTSSSTLVALSVALGFFFLPAFALLLTMTAELVDAKDTAASTALVMLAGNAGGVVVVALMGAVAEWSRTNWLVLTAITVVAVAIAFVAPETARQPAASGK